VVVVVGAHGAAGGRLVVAIRAGKVRRTITADVVKGATKTVVAVGSLPRHARVQIVAVAANTHGQASKAAKRIIRVR
jgi:hypothetical protein